MRSILLWGTTGGLSTDDGDTREAGTTDASTGRDDVGVGEAWIGLSDIAAEGAFEWTDQTQVGDFNWRDTQPDNWEENEHCVEKESDGGWNDLPCDRTKAFVCKDVDP